MFLCFFHRAHSLLTEAAKALQQGTNNVGIAAAATSLPCVFRQMEC